MQQTVARQVRENNDAVAKTQQMFLEMDYDNKIGDVSQLNTPALIESEMAKV